VFETARTFSEAPVQTFVQEDPESLSEVFERTPTLIQANNLTEVLTSECPAPLSRSFSVSVESNH